MDAVVVGGAVVVAEVDGADRLPVAGASAATEVVDGVEVDGLLPVTGTFVTADAADPGVPGRAAPGELPLRPMRKPMATKMSVEITPTATQTICRPDRPWLREDREPPASGADGGGGAGGIGRGVGGGRSVAMGSANRRAPAATIDHRALLALHEEFPSTREAAPSTGSSSAEGNLEDFDIGREVAPVHGDRCRSAQKRPLSNA